MSAALLESLKRDDMARLRFVVCRELGLVPGSLSARLLTRRQVLTLACHLVLERERGGGEENSRFDMARFYALKGERA